MCSRPVLLSRVETILVPSPVGQVTRVQDGSNDDLPRWLVSRVLDETPGFCRPFRSETETEVVVDPCTMNRSVG